MELPDRIRMLRDVGVKLAIKSRVIKLDKKGIANLTPKKTIALECQALGINKIDSFTPEMKEAWINQCYNALRMMYDDEVDQLARVALFFGETYQMRFFAQDVKNGNWKNKEALELITKNMTGTMGDLIIK
tara:strand:+ start:1543 stop:1935 length:393 start_codon:yes stop_codon:yes gene_type:complete